MPAPSPIKQLSMPRLSGARLDNFSLYSAKKSIKVTFTKGAFCLAGANGLGKSTFLAAVNFGLTGIVADPNRKFESVSEYYDHSLGFAEEFFDGRVEEKDRDRAQISLDFEIGAKVFHLTRGFFEREHLRAFSVATRYMSESYRRKSGSIPSSSLFSSSNSSLLLTNEGTFCFGTRTSWTRRCIFALDWTLKTQTEPTLYGAKRNVRIRVFEISSGMQQSSEKRWSI